MATSVQLSFADLGTAETAGPMEASPAHAAHATRDATSKRLADHAALAALEAALVEARDAADDRPPLVVLAACLGQLGSPPTPSVVSAASLRQARDDWLRRLETAHKSESALVAYRVAIDDLLDWCELQHRNVLDEQTIVDYLSAYEQRAHPAPATYYRRFLLIRRFLRWATRREGVPDPFLDLEPPPKPRQERDWLTPLEFRRLLDAAAHPQRNLPGLAERDRLALLALVTTGLRRSELCALEWRDLDLDGRRRSLLVRCGKGGKPRRQPVPAGLARELRNVRDARQPEATDPVFCGLAGRRLQETILADIIRRAATRAGIDKHVTAHTLRHTAATWLRQEMGDTRLAAEYLGHADISTISRYAHVERTELFEAAGRLERLANSSLGPKNPQPETETTGPGDPASSQTHSVATPAEKPRRRRVRGRRRRRR
ncbi:MAG TPA: tyrosine-type recombinase/integrase [Gaiellaceae bacterium]|jgi:integrase/recombinase XerC|nr:tyrosine-type recombinase/integrase [Gaiellaceae bacterium]